MTSGVEYSLKYFVKNNILFLKSLFDYKFILPFATAVNFIGILAVIYFGYLFISGKLFKEKQEKHVTIISATCILVNWTIFTSFYEGGIDFPSSIRYYVVFVILLSIFALLLINRLKVFKKQPAYALVLSVAMFMVYNPVSVENQYTKTLTLPREYRFAVDFLEKVSKRNKNFLVITKRPGQYTVHSYGAVAFEYANSNESVTREFKNRLYENIYVIQDIEYKTGKPTKETLLNPRYKLKTMAESQNRGEYFTRISRVAGIEGGKPAKTMQPR